MLKPRCDVMMCLLSAWLQESGRVTSALVDAFRRLDYDLSLEAQVHLSMSSPRSFTNHCLSI